MLHTVCGEGCSQTSELHIGTSFLKIVYLLISGCAGSLLLCTSFLYLQHVGFPIVVGSLVSENTLWASRQASLVAAHGFSCPVESSLTRHQTHVLCFGRQIPIHWATKEGPRNFILRNLPSGNCRGRQWLRLHTPNTGGLGLIPGQVTGSCMLQQRSHVLQLRQTDKEKETFLCVTLMKHVARPLQLCSPS